MYSTEGITFKIFSSNPLVPEIITIHPPPATKRIINPPTTTKEGTINCTPANDITILSDLFFTNLVCGRSVDGLYISDTVIPDISKSDVGPDLSNFDVFIAELSFWRRWGYMFMKSKVRGGNWIEKELFKWIA